MLIIIGGILIGMVMMTMAAMVMPATDSMVMIVADDDDRHGPYSARTSSSRAT